MRHSIQVLSTMTACLSLTSLAVAQTTMPAEIPSSQAPAANDSIGNLPPTALPPQPPQPPQPSTATTFPPVAAPAVPVTPVASGATPVTSSASPPSSPMPPAPVPLRVRVHDCTSNWIRGGFYLRFASGIGDVNVAGNGPKGDASLSGLGSNSLIAIGGSIVRGLVLAGTIQASTVSSTFNGGPFVGENVTSNGRSLAASSKSDASASLVGILVDWYPDASDGWHVGLSAGLGATSIKNHADDSTMSGTSGAGSFFGGYDWSIGPAWSIGLALVGSGVTSASLKGSSDQSDTGYHMKSYSVGVSGSFLYF